MLGLWRPTEDPDRVARGADQRRWYVNREGQTMVFIDGPLVYDMGTSKSDPDYQEEELQHRQEIPRRFFIASTEVSNEEFKRYAISESIAGHKYKRPKVPIRTVR